MSRQPFAEADGKAILLKLRSMDPASYWDETNRVQKSLWRTLESALTTILTLTPRILSQNMGSGSVFIRGATSQVVTVLSAATILSSVTKTLLSSTKLSRASGKQRRHRALDHGKLSKVISEESHAIIELVERLKGRPSPQVIHPALIAHAHQLVDALLAFCSPLTAETLDPPRRCVSPERMHPADITRSTEVSAIQKQAFPVLIRRQGSYSKADVHSTACDTPLLLSEGKPRPFKANSVGKRLIRSLIKSRQVATPADLHNDDIQATSSTTIRAKNLKSNTTLKFLFGKDASSRPRALKDLFTPTSKRSSITTQTSVSTTVQNLPQLNIHAVTQRSSVQLLVSPFAKRTELRMTKDDVDEYASCLSPVGMPSELASERMAGLSANLTTTALERHSELFPITKAGRLLETEPFVDTLPSPPLSAGMHRANFSSWSMDTVSTYSDLDSEIEAPQRPLGERETKRQSSSQATVHAGHVNPTIVQSCRVTEKSETKHFWGTDAGRLRHYRSESDLAPLRRMLTTTRNTPASFPRARKSPQPRYASNHANATSDKKSPRQEGFRFGLKAKQEPQCSLSIRRNQSSISLKKIPENSKIPLQERADIPKEDSCVKHCDGSILHVSENGHEVLVMEMVSGKLLVIAATAEKLFLKLADETTQDPDYVDTYLMNHFSFTNSVDLLENLMARFHLQPQRGEMDYFNKWQRSIQEKVLNVINRWIKLQYQDFKNSAVLLTRLEAFLNGDVRRAGFIDEACMIREAIDLQMQQHTRNRHSLVALTSHSLFSFSNSASPPSSPTSLFSYSTQRRPSAAPSLMSMVSSLSTPPDSPTAADSSTTVPSVLLTLDAKDIARYLTLSDFYILKCITAYEFLHDRQKNTNHETGSTSTTDYIGLMTKRANMLSHWVTHEVCTLKQPKQRRAAIKKLLEIAKDCQSWNNFHTSMVITIGLTCPALQKLDEWQSLSSRDINTLKMLQKNLDVSNNMNVYRKSFSKAKAPSIPFFPLVLKDLTFFLDGNRTQFREDALINFAKFRSLSQFVHCIQKCTSENYWFAGDLEHFPFFSHRNDERGLGCGGLDTVADRVEQRIRLLETCYSNPRCDGHPG